MPTVSVVLPTYNRSHLVCHAVDSILAQTYSDLELIVVDDGSRDDTPLKLKKYGNRIQYVHQDRQGSSEARNTALALARGQYIAFLDSDDVWLPRKLERQVPVLDQNPQVGLVHTFTEMIDGLGNSLPEESAERLRLHQKAFRRGYTHEAMSFSCVLWPSTILVRKKCFDELGGFDPHTESVEDWDLYLRLITRYDFYCLPEVLVQFRHHEGHRARDEAMRGRVNTALKQMAILEQSIYPFKQKSKRGLTYNLVQGLYMALDLAQCRRHIWNLLSRDPGALTLFPLARLVLLCLMPKRLIKSARKVRYGTVER